MKALTDEELRMNAQAISVATSVLGAETVEAATRCELVDLMDQGSRALGIGGFNRGAFKAMRGVSKAMMPRVAGDVRQMETGGLPKSFVLAVTADRVHAIEDKHDRGKLVAGKVLESWDREGFTARRDSGRWSNILALPDDREILTISLPREGYKSKKMQFADRVAAATGQSDMPVQVAVGKDAASQKLVASLVSTSPPAWAGNQYAREMMYGQLARLADARDRGAMSDEQFAALKAKMLDNADPAEQFSVDPAQQLAKLADLRDRGVLSDQEFAAQKAKILGTS
jgi:hypothetical protein